MNKLSLTSLAPLVLIHIRLIQIKINVVSLQNGRILVLSKSSAILALVLISINNNKWTLYVWKLLSSFRIEVNIDHGEILPA